MAKHEETGVAALALADRELADEELSTVVGGLNPQPLPPRVAYFPIFNTAYFAAAYQF